VLGKFIVELFTTRTYLEGCYQIIRGDYYIKIEKQDDPSIPAAFMQSAFSKRPNNSAVENNKRNRGGPGGRAVDF
jgi:hypothetical protein